MAEQPAGWSAPDEAPATGLLPPPVPPAAGPAADPVPDGPVVPLRPLGVGELLDTSVAVARARPRPVFALSAVVAVVGALLRLALTLTVLPLLAGSDLSVLTSGQAVDGLLGGAVLAAGATLLVGSALGAVLTGAVTVVVGRVTLGAPVGVAEALAQVRARLVPLLAVSLLAPLAALAALLAGAGVAALLVAAAGGVGAVLAALPVLAAAVAAALVVVRWSLAPAVVMLERAPVRRALARSSALVRRSFWRVLGVLALALALAALVGGVLQLPFHLLGGGGATGTAAGDVTAREALLAAVGAALAATLVGPFTAGTRALLYLDRRMRAEGLDIVLTASAAGR